MIEVVEYIRIGLSNKLFLIWLQLFLLQMFSEENLSIKLLTIRKVLILNELRNSHLIPRSDINFLVKFSPNLLLHHLNILFLFLTSFTNFIFIFPSEALIQLLFLCLLALHKLIWPWVAVSSFELLPLLHIKHKNSWKLFSKLLWRNINLLHFLVIDWIVYVFLILFYFLVEKIVVIFLLM